MMHLYGYNVPFNLPSKILSICPSYVFTNLIRCIYHFIIYRRTIYWQLGACSISSLSYWLSAVYFLRYSLKMLFMYKGWMYESPFKGSKPSLATKIWATFVKAVGRWNTPKLYSYQSSLPRLPLPSLHETMTRVCNNYGVNL